MKIIDLTNMLVLEAEAHRRDNLIKLPWSIFFCEIRIRSRKIKKGLFCVSNSVVAATKSVYETVFLWTFGDKLLR